VIERRLFGIM